MDHLSINDNTIFSTDYQDSNFQNDDDYCSLFEIDEDNIYECNSENGQTNSEKVNNFKCIKKKLKRSAKEKIQLTNIAEKFKQDTCTLLTHSINRTPRKEILLNYIHSAIDKNSSIRKLKRKEYRSIDHFYNEHADQANLILDELRKMIEKKIINYDDDYRIIISKKKL